MLRNSSTYIYLVLFLGLLCYVTFIDKKIPGTKDQEDLKNQLYKFDQETVTGLEITNVHGVFIFKKVNNHWELKQPVDALADTATVDQILGQIASTQPQRVISIDSSDKQTDATLKDWGLAPTAEERVVIHTPEKNQYFELLIGRKMAINDSVYARASGRKNEPVRILPLAIKEILQKDLSDFRSHFVFEFDPDKTTRVDTQIANTATTPAQEDEVELKNDQWTLQKPLVARASSSDVQSMLGKILSAKVVDFITDDASNLSTYGLTSPAATLTVVTKNDGDLVLQIGGPVPNKPDQVYAQRLKSNSVFTMTKASVDELLKAIPNVRDRHILSFDANRATGLTVIMPNKKFQIRRENNLWNTIGEGEGRADLVKSLDLFTKLNLLETTPVMVDSATDLAPFGLDKPQGKIVIQFKESKTDESALTLFIGKEQNKLLYVRSSLEPFIYTVPDTAFDFLPADNLPLRDARVVNLQLKEIKSMTITVEDKTPITLNRSSGGTWSPANVKDRMVDSLKADTQASLLCQLQAKSFLGPILPIYGLAKPVLAISILTDKPDGAKVTLKIGTVLPDGGHAAQIEGIPIAFDLAEGDYGILNASSIELVPSILPATNAPPAAPAKK
jgi:hypothetical protein